MRWRSLVLVLLLCAGCARDAPRFSLENARAHVQMLAGTIGSRPVGTAEDARARAYIIDQLHLYGFDVRVQETDARRPELGLSAHVNNIIAIKAGDERGALALVSHYDSAPSSPGGADDGLGVAVSLEAARVLAARDHRRHALMILLTDGEEAGLMGAAGLADDRDVMSRLQAYINIEAIGSSGTAMLFEAGPGNGWLVRPWIRAAPHPRGASYGLEIYKRLPNDTDFSILKRHDIPGLNFAPIGDSYAYHTARDTADRLSDWTLRATGENTVNTAAALDAQDLKRRSTASETFFDIGQTVAIGWGPVIAWLIAAAALVVGLLAWFKTIGAAIRLGSLWRWLLQVVWSLMGAAAVIAAMVGISWALRASRTVYHPWYASPGRFFILIAAAGALAGWIVVRAGAWLPEQARLERHPLLVWSLALPLWIALTGGMAAVAPGAGYLWSLPLLIAGAGLLAVPLTNVPAIRGISIVVLAVAGTLWLRDTLEFLQFLVPMFGRLPIVTPIWAYAALIAMCGAMVMPPLLASVAAMKPVARPSAVTAALVLVAAIAGAFAYAAPAYTSDRPQRREMRVIVDEPATTATFEVASQEPGLDLNESAPAGWYRATDAPQVSVPVGRYTMPFVFRTVAASPGPSPAMIGTLATTSASGALEASLTITPQATGLTAIIELPPSLQPIRANLPGMITSGRWRTTFVAVPPEGLTWRASFVAAAAAQLAETRVAIVSHRFPNGGGWQSLPAWLPQEHTVWSVDTMWIATPVLTR